MSAIQATSAGVRDMADGSLRITLEFDPRYSKEAYALFGARGTACAVAALTQAASVQAAREETIATEKPGPLCVLACRWCKDPDFWRFIENFGYVTINSEDAARSYMLTVLHIKSRKEIDQNPRATESFHRDFREPYIVWQAE